MTFRKWMEHQGLSQSSINKYESTIKGPISKWAMEQGIIDGPLFSLQSHAQFEHLNMQLRAIPLFKERDEIGKGMYSSALKKFSDYLKASFDPAVENDIDILIKDAELSETEKSQLVSTRVGQGRFRQKLINYWGRCAITGYRDPTLLIASHIKPWRVASNKERLDLHNGLLLLPNLDKAFDSGFITFQSAGNINISPMLETPDQLGVTKGMKIQLAPEHQSYMEYHRENVFRKG